MPVKADNCNLIWRKYNSRISADGKIVVVPFRSDWVTWCHLL